MIALKPLSCMWWAVLDSNQRPPRCQRLSMFQVIDLYRPEMTKSITLWPKVRKSAQDNIRKLRYMFNHDFIG